MEQSDNNTGNNERTTKKPTTRQQEIVGWLASSKLAIQFKNGKGFFVPKGLHVRLKNNQVMDLLGWVDQEGIGGGKAVSGYSIAYTEPGSKYGEKLSFFKIIVDTPFSQREKIPPEASSD